ncbi:hypothetical protein KAR48_03895 [bacterium]|nr:hypothetical protein [bacterium]
MRVNLSAHELLRLRDFIRNEWGIYFSNDRINCLERHWKRLVEHTEIDDERLLLNNLMNAKNGENLHLIFIQLLTVGETYFMRERHTLAFLEDAVLLPLIKERMKTEKRLRIWSAGCCTGEEPYSIAMMLCSIIPDIHLWDIQILATDINPKYLNKAKNREYGSWSFRQTDDSIKQRFFTRKNNVWKLNTQAAKLVSFYPLNFMSKDYSTKLPPLFDIDLIVCRNVLMYFHMADSIKIIKKFYNILTDGGWLAVGASESCHTMFEQFDPVCTSNACIYQKRIKYYDCKIATLENDQDNHVINQKENYMVQHEDYERTSRISSSHTLKDAMRAITTDKLHPDHHRAKAMFYQSTLSIDKAIQSWKTVLFLSPLDTMAHFNLARIFVLKGSLYDARRCCSNALCLLGEQNPSTEVPNSDGLNVSELVRLIVQINDGTMNA